MRVFHDATSDRKAPRWRPSRTRLGSFFLTLSSQLVRIGCLQPVGVCPRKLLQNLASPTFHTLNTFLGERGDMTFQKVTHLHSYWLLPFSVCDIALYIYLLSLQEMSLQKSDISSCFISFFISDALKIKLKNKVNCLQYLYSYFFACFHIWNHQCYHWI